MLTVVVRITIMLIIMDVFSEISRFPLRKSSKGRNERIVEHLSAITLVRKKRQPEIDVF